jgi:hypothetical protein
MAFSTILPLMMTRAGLLDAVTLIPFLGGLMRGFAKRPVRAT